MSNLTTYSRHPQDDPVLQQLETYVQHLSLKQKAALALVALYEATKPRAIDFDYICQHCPKYNKSIVLLHGLSTSGLFALTRAILEELAVTEQLQEAIK